MEFKYFSLIIAIFPITIMILSIINVKVKPVSTILNEIRSSLNDYPLSEFEYASNCYDKYNGNLYTFPGSQHGCTCVHISYYYYDQTGEKQVNIGKCTSNQTYNGCEEVPAVKMQKLQNWNYGKFCSKSYELSSELKGYLYFLNSSVLENEECQKGYKRCGKLDDMGNYLCLPENEECPINDIIVSTTILSDLTDYNYTRINGKYFYYTNLSDKPIISKLKVMEGKMCMDRAYYYTEYPQYILDNNFKYYGCKHKIEGEIYDKNIETLDTRTKEVFYSDNRLNLKDYYYQWYFDFPFYSLNAQMNLYPQRYLGYDKQCLIKNGVFDIKNSPFDEKKINEMDKLINDVIFKNKINMWFSIFISGLSLIISIILVANEGKMYIFWSLFNFLFFIMMLVPIILNIIKVPKFIQMPDCGNKITNIKINYYNSTAKTLKITTIISVVFIGLYLIYNFAFIFLKFFAEDILFGDYNYNYNNNYNNNKSNLINNHNYSSNIDYQKPPEDPYYGSSDFLSNNGPSGIDNAKPQPGYSTY